MEQSEHVGVHLLEDPIAILNSKVKHKVTSIKQKGGYSTTSEQYPNRTRLIELEKVARQDSVVKGSLDYMCRSIISNAGKIYHPDPEIQEFTDKNLNYLQEKTGTDDWTGIIEELLFTTFWSGMAVGEKLFKKVNDQLLLDDVAIYHPNSIFIVPNKKGRLVEGEKSYSHRRSGVYQIHTGLSTKLETKLDLNKIIYIRNGTRFNNYLGESVIPAVYKWVCLKEVLLDMMVVALDRFGKPMIYIVMPSYPTDQLVRDPITGEDRYLTTLETLQSQLEQNEGNINYLTLPQVDKDNKPSIGSLTTGNNIGSTFLNTIRFLDEYIAEGIGTPYFLINSSVAYNSDVAEKKMATFYDTLAIYRKKLLDSICRQMFWYCIRYNFNRESARIPPQFTTVYSDRPEDRVATMQMVKGMTDLGYFNPKNADDFSMVRQMVRANDRELTKADIKFIDQLHSKGKEGRPANVSTPLQQARPIVDNKPTGEVTTN